MSDTSGPTSSEAFAWYDHDSSCWRTSQGTLDLGLTPSSVTLPSAGSMRDGWLFERQTPALPTDVPDCSSLLGTPTAHDRTHSPRQVHHGVQLANQVVELLPTPTASQPGGTAEQMLARKAKMPGGARATVTDLRMVVELLPTPTATDAKGSRNSTVVRKPGSTAAIGDTLTDAAWMLCLLPTPTARPGAAGPDYRQRPNGPDLQAAVRELTGANTPPPSPDGND